MTPTTEGQDIPQSCPSCHHTTQLGYIRKRNHTLQAYAYCITCDHLHGGITLAAVWDSGINPEELPVFYDHTEDRQCAVTGCPNTDLETHHFAPTSIFGPDANNWPQADLCRHHHHTWHHRTGIATGTPR